MDHVVCHSLPMDYKWGATKDGYSRIDQFGFTLFFYLLGSETCWHAPKIRDESVSFHVCVCVSVFASAGSDYTVQGMWRKHASRTRPQDECL